MGKAEEHLAFLQIKVCDSSAIVILRERSPALKLAPFPTLSINEVAHFWAGIPYLEAVRPVKPMASRPHRVRPPNCP